MIIGVPEVTTVMRERLFAGSVSATVRLSMLSPRPENRPMTRASTPGSLSTRTAMVCCSMAAVMIVAVVRPSHQHHALFRDGAAGLVGRAEQHLVVGRAGWDHGETILELVDADIGDH